MIIIKRTLVLILTFALTLSMIACSASDPSNNGENIEAEPVEERSYNYLNGKELSNPDLKTQRPIAIMVDNSKNALPQSGLEPADIIYEMVTEGGITRLMAVYSDTNNVHTVGPIRSARDQFVQFMLPLNAIYVHIGTSIYASDMLNFYGYQDIDGLYLGVTSFKFDNERSKSYAHEHCWFTDEGLIKSGIKTTGLSLKGNLYPAFNFADYTQGAGKLANGNDATDISFRFSGYADAAFHYNNENGRYYKDTFGTPHMDAATGNQLSFDNVLLLNTTVALYPDGLCTAFDLSGGEGYYFYGGKYIPVTWKKGDPRNPLQIFDTEGNAVQINVGKTYVAIIDDAQLETLEMSGAVQNVESGEEIVPAE